MFAISQGYLLIQKYTVCQKRAPFYFSNISVKKVIFFNSVI